MRTLFAIAARLHQPVTVVERMSVREVKGWIEFWSEPEPANRRRCGRPGDALLPQALRAMFPGRMTMAATIPERELFALLDAALTGNATVRWGWKALETATEPPSLPLVTLQRTLASASAYADMCIDLNPLVDTSLQVHVWVDKYEAARALNTQVRAIVLGGGWALQAEIDVYEPAFRAWRISGDYLGAGMAVE